MDTCELIWMNGEFLAWEDAKVHVLTHGLHYGTGVFEGIRCYDTELGPAIFRNAEHMERLLQSSELYYMPVPYTAAKLQAAARELVANNNLRSCYIRPIVYRGYGSMGLNPMDAPVDVTIACWEWGTYLGEDGMANGIRAKVSSWRRISPDSLIPHAKASGQYLNNVLAKVESMKAGYQEAILLDGHGHVCEGTGENIYIVAGGEIVTPGHHNSILDGITRRSIMQLAADLGYPVVERNIARAEMYLADEVFMSGTAAELVPVVEVDDHKVGSGKPGEVTRLLQSAFDDAIHGRSEPYREWLDVVSSARLRHLRRAPRADMGPIQLYDATLRDGMGGGGMSLTAQEKLRVVHALDALGAHLIEAGFPASNPKELELFALLEHESLTTSEIVAFGMTRRRDAPADQDEGLRILAESFVPVCTLVGKSSPLHVEKVVRVSPEENLAMISESIVFLHAQGKRVLFDAEHFFDGYAVDPAYALDTLRAAAAAGAERVVLCDTNGGSLPGGVRAVVETVQAELPDLALGIHTHDDGGCAVANTLVAVEAGATQVQGTINGIGERTGNANLVTIIANLQLKMGYEVLAPERLARLTETAHLLDELLNRAPNPAQPYVGKHAFAHKAGLHTAADPRRRRHVRAHRPGAGW